MSRNAYAQFPPTGKFEECHLGSFNGQDGLGQVGAGMLEDVGVREHTSKILGLAPPNGPLWIVYIFVSRCKLYEICEHIIIIIIMIQSETMFLCT